MTKLTYSEQLKHPNWQRKRLEVLEHYGFKCSTCQAAEKTLHVHHKRYVKGRLAWEYELIDLEALCEDCHEAAHEAKARIDRVIAQFPSEMWSSLADVLVGYGEEHVAVAEWEHVSELHARLGQMAWLCLNYDETDVHELIQGFHTIGPNCFLDAIREAAKPF